jgi:hexokinase
MDPDVARRHTVAIDGSVYEKLYGFSGRMAASLGTLLGRRASRVRLVLTKDGSGRGAAIVAAVAERDRNI